jgi:hypothetical protein
MDAPVTLTWLNWMTPKREQELSGWAKDLDPVIYKVRNKEHIFRVGQAYRLRKLAYVTPISAPFPVSLPDTFAKSFCNEY